MISDDFQIGNYQAQMLVYLEEYPDIKKSVDFSVIINPCQVSAITLENGPEDTSYAITSEMMKLSTPSINQGVCQYPVTFEILKP